MNSKNVRDGQFNKEKFKEVLHYIIDVCGKQDNIGKTVLYKLLYFSDFNFYELFEHKLTGEIYTKLPRGPGPKHFESTIEELKKEHKIKHTIKHYDHHAHQNRYISLKKPHTELLTNNEKQVIDNVLKKCSQMSSTQISNYSHEDLPWQATDLYTPIDYELVFYRTPEFSVRDYGED